MSDPSPGPQDPLWHHNRRELLRQELAKGECLRHLRVEAAAYLKDANGMARRIAKLRQQVISRDEDLERAVVVEAQRDALLEALLRVEWSCEEWEDGEEYRACPECGEPQANGHLRDCCLSTAIAKARGEVGGE